MCVISATTVIFFKTATLSDGITIEMLRTCNAKAGACVEESACKFLSWSCEHQPRRARTASGRGATIGRRQPAMRLPDQPVRKRAASARAAVADRGASDLRYRAGTRRVLLSDCILFLGLSRDLGSRRRSLAAEKLRRPAPRPRTKVLCPHGCDGEVLRFRCRGSRTRSVRHRIARAIGEGRRNARRYFSGGHHEGGNF